MRLSIDKESLKNYTELLIATYFPDRKNPLIEGALINASLERLEFCFTNINKKYYSDDKGALFNHLNSDQFCSYLYFLSNEAYKLSNIEMAEKFFYLNKIMHGIDLFYSVELPDIFLMVHPLGTVIGNATFHNYSVFYQNVTIGSDMDGIYPVFGGSVIFFSGSSVIGNCRFDDNVIVGARSFILKESIPANTVVTGQSRLNLKKSSNKKTIRHDFFGLPENLE